MAEFVFDGEKHLYTLDGNIVPSVTQVLSATGFVPSHSDDPFYAERGRAAHAAIALDLLGSLDEESVDEHIRPYLTNSRSVRADLRIGHPMLVETPLYCDCMKDQPYAGTVDLAAVVGGRVSVIDWKTGEPEPWHLVQIAAYIHLVHKHFLRDHDHSPGGFAVYLKSRKAATIADDSVDRVVELFGCALNLYNGLRIYGARKDRLH